MSTVSPTTDRGRISLEATLLDVRQVATLLGCSQRHIYRLCDAKQMPQPIRLRTLVRWNRQELEDWIAEGCPASPDQAHGSEVTL